MNDKRIVVEINGDVRELTLTGEQAAGLKNGHEIGDWFRDFLWREGGASFEAVKDDPRYREDQNGPWMEMVVRVSAPASFDCLECQGEGGDYPEAGHLEMNPAYFEEDEGWIECAACKGSGKEPN